jgi:hypothetical protein
MDLLELSVELSVTRVDMHILTAPLLPHCVTRRMQREGWEARPVCLAGVLAWSSDQLAPPPAHHRSILVAPKRDVRALADAAAGAAASASEPEGPAGAKHREPLPAPALAPAQQQEAVQHEGKAQTPLEALIALGKACMSGEPSSRPTFAGVVKTLDRIMAAAEAQLHRRRG